MKRAIILFTRVPKPGQTKTGLMPELTQIQSAKLHACFLKDISKECTKTGADIFVCYTPTDKKGKQHLQKILGKDYHYFPQVGEDLGERMYNAVESIFKVGYDACILLNSDVPEVSYKYLNRTFNALDENDVILGRTTDGGFYLVGLQKPIREAFELKHNGNTVVLRETVKNLEQSGYLVGYTNTLSDIDTYEDLVEFRKRAQKFPLYQTSYTRAYIEHTKQISIIVPVYNDEKIIEKFQAQLGPIVDQVEVIFVDGGSSDRTRELILPQYTVICTKKGRAAQMNLGAQKSHGDILLFLHSDSKLPNKPVEEIRSVMKRHQAGCFGITFQYQNPLMQSFHIVTGNRIQRRKVLYDDQGIFISRELFFEIGMFPEDPKMEDYQLSLDFKDKKIKLGSTKHRLICPLL